MPAGSIHYAAAAPRISRNAFSFLLLREGKERRRSLARSSKEEEHERNGTERNGTEKLISILFSICQDFPAARVYKRPSLLSPLNYSLPIHSCASAFHRFPAEQRNNCFSLSPFASPPFFLPLPPIPDFPFSRFRSIKFRRGVFLSNNFDNFRLFSICRHAGNAGSEMERVNPNSRIPITIGVKLTVVVPYRSVYRREDSRRIAEEWEFDIDNRETLRSCLLTFEKRRAEEACARARERETYISKVSLRWLSKGSFVYR